VHGEYVSDILPADATVPPWHSQVRTVLLAGVYVSAFRALSPATDEHAALRKFRSAV
jgi:hypothetical protein